MHFESTSADIAVATPPSVAVASHFFLGITLDMWLIYLNLTYIVIALAWKLWGIYKESRNVCK